MTETTVAESTRLLYSGRGSNRDALNVPSSKFRRSRCLLYPTQPRYQSWFDRQLRIGTFSPLILIKRKKIVDDVSLRLGLG